MKCHLYCFFLITVFCISSNAVTNKALTDAPTPSLQEEWSQIWDLFKKLFYQQFNQQFSSLNKFIEPLKPTKEDQENFAFIKTSLQENLAPIANKVKNVADVIALPMLKFPVECIKKDLESAPSSTKHAEKKTRLALQKRLLEQENEKITANIKKYYPDRSTEELLNNIKQEEKVSLDIATCQKTRDTLKLNLEQLSDFIAERTPVNRSAPATMLLAVSSAAGGIATGLLVQNILKKIGRSLYDPHSLKRSEQCLENLYKERKELRTKIKKCRLALRRTTQDDPKRVTIEDFLKKSTTALQSIGRKITLEKMKLLALKTERIVLSIVIPTAALTATAATTYFSFDLISSIVPETTPPKIAVAPDLLKSYETRRTSLETSLKTHSKKCDDLMDTQSRLAMPYEIKKNLIEWQNNKDTLKNIKTLEKRDDLDEAYLTAEAANLYARFANAASQ